MNCSFIAVHILLLLILNVLILGQFWGWPYKCEILCVKHQGTLISVLHLDVVCDKLSHLKSVLLCASGELC